MGLPINSNAQQKVTMTRRHTLDPVRVSLGECLCPDTPHDEDYALLRPRLLPGDAIAALSALRPDVDSATLQRDIGMSLLRGGLIGWNIQDETGPIPLDAIEDGTLDWDETLRPIAEAANDLYSESLLRPLVERMKKPSHGGRTDD